MNTLQTIDTVANHFCEALQKEICLIHERNLSDLQQCEQTINAISETTFQLHQWVFVHPFSSSEHEIYFFKHIKPKFKSQLIFNYELFRLKSSLPVWDKEKSRKILREHLTQIQCRWEEQVSFYQYFKNNRTTQDDVYFLRCNHSLDDHIDSLHYDTDPTFSTRKDYWVARFIADEMLVAHINKKLICLNEENESQRISSISSLYWTSNKIGLTELIYAIHAAKCINNGNVEIKEIAQFFEQAFHVDLGDFYHDFKQIKARCNQTKFIDFLKQSFSSKIVRQDD
ncbi:MAG: RteC domain-containing protein [Marinilabiliaceae bacterium]|nr:RteC domain-containing protein [Marinilabiliaceae bacterium]